MTSNNGTGKKEILKYGFIYPIFDFLVEKVKSFNATEGLKELFKSFGSSQEQQSILSRIAVDVFIVLKWIYIIILLKYGFKDDFHTGIIRYLLIMNLFTYCYYHVWKCRESSDLNVTKRGFLHLMIAFLFSNFCYAYLYFAYAGIYFSQGTISQDILFSFSNSMTIDYDGIVPLRNYGNFIAITQILATFIFVTLVIANSIPKAIDESNGNVGNGSTHP